MDEQKEFCRYINERSFLKYANAFLETNKGSMPLHASMQYTCLVDSVSKSEGPLELLLPRLLSEDPLSDELAALASLVLLGPSANVFMRIAVDALLYARKSIDDWLEDCEAPNCLTRAKLSIYPSVCVCRSSFNGGDEVPRGAASGRCRV